MQRLWLTITITITFVIITIIIIMIAGKCLQRLWCRRHCPCCSTPEDDLLGSANLRTTSTGSTLLSRFQTTSSYPSSSSTPSSAATRAVLSLDLRYTLPDMETTLPDTERRTRLLSHRSAQHRSQLTGEPAIISLFLKLRQNLFR